jgi:flagellar biosynthesis protein FliQ
VQTLCECMAAYLVTSWVVGLIWVIQDWDKIIAEHTWMCYFPRLAIIAVVLHILVSPYSIPEAVWRAWHEDA